MPAWSRGVPADEGRGDDPADVLDRRQDALAAETGRVPVAQLHRLVHAGRRPGGDAGPAERAVVEDDITSMVGLPRESRISRAVMDSMVAFMDRPFCRRDPARWWISASAVGQLSARGHSASTCEPRDVRLGGEEIGGEATIAKDQAQGAHPRPLPPARAARIARTSSISLPFIKLPADAGCTGGGDSQGDRVARGSIRERPAARCRRQIPSVRSKRSTPARPTRRVPRRSRVRRAAVIIAVQPTHALSRCEWA